MSSLSRGLLETGFVVSFFQLLHKNCLVAVLTLLKFFFFFFFLTVCFLGPHLWHMEVPRLGVELELQLPVKATATADAGSRPHLWPTPQLMAMLDPLTH